MTFPSPPTEVGAVCQFGLTHQRWLVARHRILITLASTLAMLLLAESVGASTNIVVSIDGYKQQFKGGGCQSTMWGNFMGSLSDQERAQAMDWLFSDLNMGYLRDNRYTTEGLARNSNLKLNAYLNVDSSLEVNGKLNISDSQVYNKLATNWFNHLQDQHAAGEDVNIARLLNEPDYEESQTPGALGYSGNPQKGFALIINNAVGRLVDMLANTNINSTGVPRPLFMFPNTLDAGQCVSYLTEIKKSNYPRGWGLVDIVSTHQYGSGVSTSTFNSIASAASGRRMIMSEMYPNRGDSLGSLPIDDESRAVLSLAQLISVPVNAGFDSWWYWQINYGSETPLALLALSWGNAWRPKHYWGFLQLTSLQPYNSYVLNRSVSGLGSVSVIAMRNQQGGSYVTVSMANNEGSVKTAGVQLKNAGTNIAPYAYYQYLTGTNDDFTVTGPFLVAPGASTFAVNLPPYSLTTIRALLNAPPTIPAALGHWSLDDAQGTVATDSSGNGYNATLGTGNTWTNGIINTAIQYPAGYYPTTASQNLGSVNQLSYSCWFNLGAYSSAQYLGGSTGTNPWAVYINGSSPTLRFSVGGDIWETGDVVPTNEWHHLVATFDVTNRIVRVYLDGALRASTTRSTMSPITLGSTYWGGRVNGPMDDVWLFNSVLTQSQVESLHFRSFRTPPASPAITTTGLASSANPSAAGNNVTFTATVRASGVTALDAGGTVVFKDGVTALTSNAVSGGVATFTTSALGLGSHLMTAVYGGDPLYYLASTSAPVAQLISSNTSTTTAFTALPNPSTVGSNVTFTATVRVSGVTAGGAGGTMIFRDGTTALRTNAVSGGVATFTTSALTYGSHLMKAEYNGSGLYLSSTSAPLAQIVLNPTATTTALDAWPNPAVVGGDVTFTATVQVGGVTAGSAGGTIVFKDGTTPLSTNTPISGVATLTTSTLGSGSHPITALYSGSGPYLASTSAPLTQIVTLTATATTLASSPNPSLVGGNVTFTATVQASAAQSGSPSGTMVFKDGATPLSTNVVSGSTASFTTSALTYGSHLMTSVYSGDGLNLASTSAPLSQIVQTPVATTTVLSSYPNPSLVGNDVNLTATVNTNGMPTGGDGGMMVFMDGATVLSTNAVFGGTAGITISTPALGSHSLTAAYSGYGIYLASTSAPVAQVVQLPVPSAPTNITWSVSGGSLTISWPADYLGWILQSQTNALNVGLGTNWTDIPDSAGVTSTNLPILQGNPSVYYRLRFP